MSRYVHAFDGSGLATSPASAIWQAMSRSLLGLMALAWGLLSYLEVARGQDRAGPQDLALVLAIDISNSVDWWEYRFQRRGLAHAVRHPEVIAAIRSGPNKRIAVSVVQWSGSRSQIVAVPWTFIASAEDAIALSQRVARMERLSGGYATHIGGMIAYGRRMLDNLPFDALRKVIDISGDGHDNITKAPGQQRDLTVSKGIVINGLVIENEEKDLRAYYERNIIGGPGAFVIRTTRYRDYGEAMQKKLVREIAPKMLTRAERRHQPG